MTQEGTPDQTSDTLLKKAEEMLQDIENDLELFMNKYCKEQEYKLENELVLLERDEHPLIAVRVEELDSKRKQQIQDMEALYRFQLKAIHDNFQFEKDSLVEQQRQNCKLLWSDLLNTKYQQKYRIVQEQTSNSSILTCAVTAKLDVLSLLKKRKRDKQEVKLLGQLLDNDYFPASEVDGLCSFEIYDDLERINIQ